MSEAETPIEFGDDRFDVTQKTIRSATFLHILDTGQPAAIKAIAQATQLPEPVATHVLEAFREQGMAQIDDGHVFGIAGISVTRTRHTLHLSQGERWTWCALDAIGIVGALGFGTITSQSHKGDITLSLDDGIFRPEGTAIFIADGYGTTNSIGQWCPLVDFFFDQASADHWAEQNEVPGRGVSITRLAPVAAERWRTIIEDGRDATSLPHG